jgi:hypothetical protein
MKKEIEPQERKMQWADNPKAEFWCITLGMLFVIIIGIIPMCKH